MRLSKKLLQSIAIGVSLTAVTSCSLNEVDAPEDHLESCNEDCEEVHATNDNYQHNWENCPACGMG